MPNSKDAESLHNARVNQIHELRKRIDTNIQLSESLLYGQGNPYGREMALVRTKLQEAKMWAGECLEAIGSEFPEELRDRGNPPA